MIMALEKFIVEGEKFPRGYGFSYRCFYRCGDVCYPVPLNLIVRWGRNVWFWLRGSVTPSWVDKRLLMMYELGRQHEQELHVQRIRQLEARVDVILSGVPR